MRRVPLLLLMACSGSKESAPPVPDDHQLHRTETPDSLQIVGKAVPLASVVPAELLGGLPVSGDIDVSIDVRGTDDLRKATGAITVACPAGCQLGDDKTKLKVQGRAARLAPDGITFGHLALSSARVAISIRDSKATIETWQVSSPDLTLTVSGSLQLQKTLDASMVDLCVRFAPTPGLDAREPATAAVLNTVGAPRGADGNFNIRLTGQFSAPRILSTVCDGSAPPLAPPIAVASGAKSDNTVAPATAAAITAAITKTSDTTFDIDASKIEPLLADPAATTKGGRVVPAVRNGQLYGMKLYAIAPESLYAKLGLANGDTLLSINGKSLTTAADALEVYTSVRTLKRGDRVEAAIERRGTPTKLVYTLR